MAGTEVGQEGLLCLVKRLMVKGIGASVANSKPIMRPCRQLD